MWLRRLNGIKKVYYLNSFNINILSVLLSAAAEAGDPVAQFNIGNIFQVGRGVMRNEAKAAEWYQKGMLSQILQNINTLIALFRQPPKLDYRGLNIFLVTSCSTVIQ
jgi:hypothetical protein